MITDVSPSRFDRRETIIVDDTVKIPLGVNAKDGYAVVDVCDKWLESYQWYKNAYGYAATGNNKLMHRIILNQPLNMDVDHKDRNRLNNRRGNLRIATRRENLHNLWQSTNKTGYKGVCYDKSRGKFMATINSKYIGRFKTPEEAALAYNEKAKELHGEFALLNNITLTKTTPATRTAITSTAIPNYNYITNPSFEVDTSGWGGTGTGSTLTRDTAVFHSGVASGKMETSADNQWVSFPLAAPASTQITLSAWVKGTAGETIHLNAWTGTTDIAGGPYTFTGEWQKIAHTFTTAASGVPEFQIRRYSGDTANPVWIDDASAVWGAA